MAQRTALQRSAGQFICGGFAEQPNKDQDLIFSGLTKSKLIGQARYDLMSGVKVAVGKLSDEATLKYARCKSATYRALKKDENC